MGKGGEDVRLPKNKLLGLLIVFIGISILLNIIHLAGILAGPLFLFMVGAFFLRYSNRMIGIGFLGLSAVVAFQNIFNINLAGLAIAAAFIYVGYRLLSGKKMWKTREKQENRKKKGFFSKKGKEPISFQKEEQVYKEDINVRGIPYQNSLLGDFRLINHQFDLKDLNLSHLIGDVKIDLSKAIVPGGENAIVISGLIGDVDIYVPYDLEVSVTTTNLFGKTKVFHYEQSGFNRQASIATNGYEGADAKVKIAITTLIGDIDVRHL